MWSRRTLCISELEMTTKIYADSQGSRVVVMTWHKWKLMVEILHDAVMIHHQNCLNIEKYYKISSIWIDLWSSKDKLIIEMSSKNWKINESVIILSHWEFFKSWIFYRVYNKLCALNLSKISRILKGFLRAKSKFFPSKVWNWVETKEFSKINIFTVY